MSYKKLCDIKSILLALKQYVDEVSSKLKEAKGVV